MARRKANTEMTDTDVNTDVSTSEEVATAKKARVNLNEITFSVRPTERSAKASHSNAGRKPSVSPYEQAIRDSYDTGSAFELNEVSLEVVESVRSHLRTVAGKLGLGLDMSIYEVAGRSDVVDVVVQARQKRVLKRNTDKG